MNTHTQATLVEAFKQLEQVMKELNLPFGCNEDAVDACAAARIAIANDDTVVETGTTRTET